jgi:mono/diheme cytochrome c family protein
MPSFPWMTDQDLEAVVDYVINLSLRGQVESYVAQVAEDYDEDEEIELVEFTDAMDLATSRWKLAETQVVRAVSAEPANDEYSVRLGRETFLKANCYKCHGEDAKGQIDWLSPEFLEAQKNAPPGEKIEINYDVWGFPAPAADITAGMLHGGRRPLDIYRRIYTGINGTPMPAFGEVYAKDPDSIWHMVHYILHIVEGGDATLGIGPKDVESSSQPEETAAEENTPAA